MTRPLTPFWPFEVWSAWWEAWGTAAYVDAPQRFRAGAGAGRASMPAPSPVPGTPDEFERFLSERSTEAHALLT